MITHNSFAAHIRELAKDVLNAHWDHFIYSTCTCLVALKNGCCPELTLRQVRLNWNPDCSYSVMVDLDKGLSIEFKYYPK